MASRLTPLDASFLDVEGPDSHMHVGFVALLDPPAGEPRPSFDDVRAHVAARLPRAPRYRQRLEQVPLGLDEPVWVDDDSFELDRHLRRSPAADLSVLADMVLSTPLARDRPLWQIWVADALPDGRLALVGKAHHCMVDGIAMVELASLLLDPSPDPPPPEPDGWRPRPAPRRSELLRAAVGSRLRAAGRAALAPLEAAADPRRASARLGRAAAALADAIPPAPHARSLNEAISPRRHLALLRRELDELRAIKRRYGTTLNDVVLAAAAGALRSLMLRRGEPPVALKAMVPVNVRDEGDELGNRISFMFVELPCDEPVAAERLRLVHVATAARKRRGEPQGARDVMGALELLPPLLHAPVARMAASPRAFNLSISNIPGPAAPLYLRGCRLAEAYPVVPLAAEHALAIGFTSVAGAGCFGVYADPRTLPDADRVAEDLDAELDALARGRRAPLRPAAAAAPGA